MTDDERARWLQSSLRADKLDVSRVAAADVVALASEAEAAGLALLDGYRALHERGEITDDEWTRITDEIATAMEATA